MDEVTPTDASWFPSHRRNEPRERSPWVVIMRTPKRNGRGSESEIPSHAAGVVLELDYVM